MSGADRNLAIGPDGRLYAGLQDGRVVRMCADGSGVETFVQTGGRPLGMKFDAGGNLVVADAFRGPLCVSPERRITRLADTVNGERVLFPNDIAICRRRRRVVLRRWLHKLRRAMVRPGRERLKGWVEVKPTWAARRQASPASNLRRT